VRRVEEGKERSSLACQEQSSISYLYYNPNLCSNCLDVSVFLEPCYATSRNMIVAIVAVFWNNIWCSVSVLRFANADCVICILAWHPVDVPSCACCLFFWFHQCTLSRKSKIFCYFYSLLGTEWESLISRIFQDLLDVSWRLENVENVRMLYLLKILLIRFVVPFTYGRIKKLFLFNFSCDICVFELFFIPLLYLLIVLSTSFLLYSFYCEVVFVSSWVLFIDVLY